MNKPNDSEPAFPSVGEGFNDPNYSASGLTKREWLAGQIASGYAALPDDRRFPGTVGDHEAVSTWKKLTAEADAAYCVMFADALLKALEKPLDATNSTG